MNDTASLLTKAREDYEAKQLQLQNEFAKTTADLLGKVKRQLGEALTTASKVYDSIPPEARNGVFGDAALITILSSMGLIEKGKARKQKAPSQFTDDKLLAFLADERTTREVIEHFDSTNPTVKRRLKALLASKKVTEEKRGTSKFWKKV